MVKSDHGWSKVTTEWSNLTTARSCHLVKFDHWSAGVVKSNHTRFQIFYNSRSRLTSITVDDDDELGCPSNNLGYEEEYDDEDENHHGSVGYQWW